MKWKTIVVGGLAFFITTQILGFASGAVIHNNILMESYQETTEFWRPELTQEPPDMAALMPYWMTTALFGALVIGGLFAVFRSALTGPGWKRGLIFGFFLALFQMSLLGGWSGVFNLPLNIWCWWAFEGFIYLMIGGMALGAVSGKLDPLPE